MTDTEADESVQNREWVESALSDLPFVEWDRFTVVEWEEGGDQVVSAYGWIDREDSHEDFAMLILWPGDETIYTLTSSDEYSEEISERLFGTSEDHNECRRAENAFDIPNVIELGEQTTLADGGSDA